MKKINLYIFGFILFVSSAGYAQEVSKVGTTAASFLNVDVGARAVGMGSAFAAVAEDITAMYWNPAGIARLDQTEAVFSNNRWILDINFNYAGIAARLSNIGTIGVNATFLTMDDMQVTTISDPDGTDEKFNAGSYAFGLAFARNLTDRFTLGFNFKYITEKIYHSSANGIAFDIGTLFDTQFSGLKIGMSISNYGTKMQMSGRDLLIQADIDPQVAGNNPKINASLNTDQFDLPLMFRVGVSMDVLKGRYNSNLLVSIDALHPSDDYERLNIGAEYVLNKMFALRAGYKSLFAEDTEEGISLGAGYRYKLAGKTTVHFDYAYQDFGVLKEIQMFTLGFGF